MKPKFALISKRPYRVKSVDNWSKTVVIEYDDRTAENDLSRSRVVLSPRKMNPEEIQEGVWNALIFETVLDYPVPEEINQRHVGSNTHARPDI